jgi:hypothetical protein
MRAAWRNPDVPRRSVQKSFEELLYGFLGEDAWRSSHISPAALVAVVEGWDARAKLVQRCHGILPGREDRHVRTAALMEGPELELDEWWALFVEGDATVLMTREEHGSGGVPQGLIPIPSGLFPNGGFSARMALRAEGAWLSEQYEALTGRQAPPLGAAARRRASKKK